MVVVLSADPSLLTSQCLAQREHLVEQLSGDALPLEGWRNADLVDLEFSRLVRVSVDHRRALSHPLVACERDNHEMARLRQIGGEAFGSSKTSTATRWRIAASSKVSRLILISMKLPPRSIRATDGSQSGLIPPIAGIQTRTLPNIRLNGGAHDRFSRKTHAANSPNARRRTKKAGIGDRCLS